MHVRLVRNLPSGESMGMAHVRFRSRECAADCVDAVAAEASDRGHGLAIRAGGSPSGRVEARFNYHMETSLSQLAEDAALASMAAQQAYGRQTGAAQQTAPPAQTGAGAGVAGAGSSQAGRAQQPVVAGRGCVYEPSSGCHYDPSSGYYVHPSGRVYHPSTQAWYEYDVASGAYAQIHAQQAGPQEQAAGSAAAAAGPGAAAGAPPAPPPASLPVTLGAGAAPLKLSLSVGGRKALKLKQAGRPPSFAADGGDEPPAEGNAPAPPAPAAAPASELPAGASDGPEVPAEHLALADFGSLVCRLCERRLPTALLLRRHLVESALHRDKYAQLCKRRAAESEYARHLEETRSHAVGSTDGTAGRPLVK